MNAIVSAPPSQKLLTPSGSKRKQTRQEIRLAAIELFYKRGFHATTLREVAEKVGIQVGSLYNHIDSKQGLLFEIMETVMLDLLEDQRQIAKGADVVERMRALLLHHVRFHGQRAKEVFVGNSELRSLDREQRNRIVGLRHEYEALFRATLEDGVRDRKFLPLDVQVTTNGILALSTSVSAWYSPRGRLSLDDIGEIYSGLVLSGIAWPPAPARSGTSRSGSAPARQPPLRPG